MSFDAWSRAPSDTDTSEKRESDEEEHMRKKTYSQPIITQKEDIRQILQESKKGDLHRHRDSKFSTSTSQDRYVV